MGYGLKLVTAPTLYAVELAEAKAQCRLDADLTDHDATLNGLIQAATDYLEGLTDRAFLTQTWDLFLEEFPGDDKIMLPKGQLQAMGSVGFVKYIDSDGASQTWNAANYQVVTGDGGFVAQGYGVDSWPTTRSMYEAVNVRFVCGWTSASLVPAGIKQAILLLVAHWFANPQAVGNVGKEVEHAVEALVTQNKLGDEFVCYGGD